MLKILIARRGGQVPLVTLKGRLDVGCGDVLTAKLQGVAGQDIVFDCAGLESITSIGMREWMRFLKTLAATVKFEFINCSLPFMEFCNLLPTSSYATRIVSLQVPFECASCKTSQADVFDVETLREIEEFDPISCPRCNGTMYAAISAFLHLGFLQATE